MNRSHVQERLKQLEEGREIDWSTAEALAIGTLLLQSECGTVYITASYSAVVTHMHAHYICAHARTHACMHTCTHTHTHTHTHTLYTQGLMSV